MADRRTKRSQTEEKQPRKRQPSWRDILRLDESYSSLILGIFVVIVVSLLLVSFVKSRHVQTMKQSTSSISIVYSPTGHNIPLTVTPTPLVSTPTSTQQQTITQPSEEKVKAGKYAVKTGDNLWDIAQHYYGSGYNWVDIARANELGNPGLIYAGQVLILPAAQPIYVNTSTQTESTMNTKGAQITSLQMHPNIANNSAITGNTYTVQKGDSLWAIAIRAYHDGNQWTKIAQANKLTNPHLIFSGNVFTIPR